MKKLVLTRLAEYILENRELKEENYQKSKEIARLNAEVIELVGKNGMLQSEIDANRYDR